MASSGRLSHAYMNHPLKKLNLVVSGEEQLKQSVEDYNRISARVSLRPSMINQTYANPHNMPFKNYKTTIIHSNDKIKKEDFIDPKTKVVRLSPQQFEVINESAHGISKKYSTFSPTKRNNVNYDMLDRAFKKYGNKSHESSTTPVSTKTSNYSGFNCHDNHSLNSIDVEKYGFDRLAKKQKDNGEQATDFAKTKDTMTFKGEKDIHYEDLPQNGMPEQSLKRFLTVDEAEDVLEKLCYATDDGDYMIFDASCLEVNSPQKPVKPIKRAKKDRGQDSDENNQITATLISSGSQKFNKNSGAESGARKGEDSFNMRMVNSENRMSINTHREKRSDKFRVITHEDFSIIPRVDDELPEDRPCCASQCTIF